MDASSDYFWEIFIKYQLKTTVIEDRLRGTKMTMIFFFFSKCTLKLRRFSIRRNYIEKVHQNDLDHSPMEITATKHVEMMWKFVDIDLSTLIRPVESVGKNKIGFSVNPKSSLFQH